MAIVHICKTYNAVRKHLDLSTFKWSCELALFSGVCRSAVIPELHPEPTAGSVCGFFAGWNTFSEGVLPVHSAVSPWGRYLRKGYGCTVTPALTFVLTHSKSESFAALRAHSEITADSGHDRMTGLHRLLQAPPQTWRVQKGWKRRSLNFIQHAHSSSLQHSPFHSANISVSCILYFCAV